MDGAESPSGSAARRLATPGEFALTRARARLGFAVIVFGIVYLIIAGRVADLTLFNEAPESSSVAAAGETVATTHRADIVDRNGTILATSLPLFSLCADGRKILDPDDAERKLLSVLPDLDTERLDDLLRGSKHCAPIKRHVTPRQYYAVNKLGIAGLEFSPDEGRTYPAGAVTAHVLGYTDIDNNGIAGIEKSLNGKLQRNADPIALTLDLRLQTILHRELSAAFETFHALGAAGLIMDIASGEILSLVSLPDFDPQRAGSADDDAKFNRATLGVYEMGSTFKIFNTAMALDSGLIKASERFDTTHPLETSHKTIRDFHASTHHLNVAEIFIESSNIGSALMADRLGAARQKAFLGQLGLMEKSSIELPEVGAPLLPPASGWGETTTMTVSFGHGIAVNAVQLAGAVATILNDGAPVRPSLLKHDPEAQERAPERLVTPRTAEIMRALMRLVVTQGTAKSAEVTGYMVAGKTGTANKQSGGHYVKDARLSSFIGVFPANAPRYLVFAMLDDPKGNAKTRGFATAGWTAAPVVSRVIGQIGPLLGLPPVEPDALAAAEHRLLRALGNDVLDSLQINTGTDDYASVESNSAQ